MKDLVHDVTPTRSEQEAALARLLRAAGRAHHEAFAHVNGRDDDWPRWYAEWLLPRLAPVLGGIPDPDLLARELAQLEEERRAHRPAPEWQTYYARRMLDRYRA